MEVAPSCVYIIPPNRDMTIFHGVLQLSVPELPRELRLPIDAFLRSPAKDQGNNARGIILFGTGTGHGQVRRHGDARLSSSVRRRGPPLSRHQVRSDRRRRPAGRDASRTRYAGGSRWRLAGGLRQPCLLYRNFQTPAEDTAGRLLYDLGNGQRNIPALRELLETILPRDQSFEGYVVEYDFPDIGRHKMLLNARRILGRAGDVQLILLAMEDAGSATAEGAAS
jgi:hypothetical protein